MVQQAHWSFFAGTLHAWSILFQGSEAGLGILEEGQVEDDRPFLLASLEWHICALVVGSLMFLLIFCSELLLFTSFDLEGHEASTRRR